MKQELRLGVVAIAAGALTAGLVANAQTVIDSLSHNGEIQWQVSQTPSTCYVEWASSAAGPWHQSWDHLRGIIVTNAFGRASVPMFFRISNSPGSNPQGLVLWLPFNGDMLDHSSYSNNPTAAGFSDLTLDRAGNPSSALRLDSGEYLTVPGNPCFATTNLTVALWAKFHDLAMIWPRLIEMGSTPFAWSLFVDQTGGTPPNLPWHFYVYGGGSVGFAYTDPVLQTNRWYHFAATFSGTRAILYQDGLPGKTGTVDAVKTSITTLYIGRRADSTTTHLFSGLMDDIRIYDRVLSAAEIAGIYSLPPESN